MSSDANLRFIKDYVTCHGTAPTHTTTYSRGTFPEDVPWDFDTWRDQFRIKILEIAEDDMVFDMTGIDVALANAFRRILLAEVPTMAIEKVFVHNNTGVLRDELVAQRLGMIPIKADPSRFEWPDMDAKNADERANLVPLENQVLKFRLKVKCRKNTSGGVDNDPINGKVLSNQLEWVPVGNQAEEFACDQPAPVHSDILIARLRPGQEIDMEMHCHKGNNSGDRGHAKWSPVSILMYDRSEKCTRTQMYAHRLTFITHTQNAMYVCLYMYPSYAYIHVHIHYVVHMCTYMNTHRCKFICVYIHMYTYGL